AKLQEDGLLTEEDLADAPEFGEGKVDFGKMIDYKMPILKKAFENFRRSDDGELNDLFRLFCQFNAFWLEDYALFRAIKLSQRQKSWQEWDEDLKLRRPEALEKARQELDDEVFEQKFYQFAFFKQWDALKKYANENAVKIV